MSSVWVAPGYFVDGSGDLGFRVEDVNGDGLPDILKGIDTTYSAWLNNGSGWVDAASVWAPPAAFKTASRADNGVRFADVNGDGLTDILWDYDNGTTSDSSAWLNTGRGWASSSAWKSPTPFTQGGSNIGRRLGDADGDGFAVVTETRPDSTSVTHFFHQDDARKGNL